MSASLETLMAFIDGELSAEEERRVAAEIAANSALNAYVQEQKAVKARLNADFAPILASPVPERFERMVMSAQQPRRKPVRDIIRQILFPAKPARIWIPAGAVAAGIAIGIGLSTSLGGGVMVQSRNGALVATGGLARMLSMRLAAEQDVAQPTRIGLSFRDKAGNLCRTFQTASDNNALAGIACREGGDWRILATAAVQAEKTSAFRQAAASLPKSLRDAMGDMISGRPLNAAAEREARTHNWSSLTP